MLQFKLGLLSLLDHYLIVLSLVHVRFPSYKIDEACQSPHPDAHIRLNKT